ncbi:hypothetical protein PMI10_02768 [Flavobacterium sp. CF136]|nr:hypothetical protein PMI10_02768 [Flavobacterium sp. CF136]
MNLCNITIAIIKVNYEIFYEIGFKFFGSISKRKS